MNSSNNPPRLLNAVATTRYLQDGCVYRSPLVPEECEARRLPGYDAGPVFMFEEHRAWDWQTVDPGLLSRPGFLPAFVAGLPAAIARELAGEDNPTTVIADWEAVRLDNKNPARQGEAIVYTRESLAALRRFVGPRGRVVAYDLPYQDNPGADESYLSAVMPEILPLVDAIGCLLYLRKPMSPESIRPFLGQHIARCRRWGGGKPLWGIFWTGYVDEDQAGNYQSEAEIEATFEACRAGGINVICEWDSIKSKADFDRLTKNMPVVRRAMGKAWARPAPATSAA